MIGLKKEIHEVVVVESAESESESIDYESETAQQRNLRHKNEDQEEKIAQEKIKYVRPVLNWADSESEDEVEDEVEEDNSFWN